MNTNSETTVPALPTNFVGADETAELTKMLELEFEQTQQVAGGVACRCCCCHRQN